jgi:hypothetical protein
MLRSILWALASAALFGLSMAGCARPAPSDAGQEDGQEGRDHSGHDQGHGAHRHGDQAAAHDHGGWWCAVHGVPESVCGQCDPKVAARLKKKGDWCQEHDRPDSQCFVCHPELEAKFAGLYEAKYGKAPPKMH